MKEKREESLLKIEEIIGKWKVGEIEEASALDDIYDVMSELSDWEEQEYRRRRDEEWKKNSVTIQSTVRYAGKLPTRPISFEDDEES